MLGVSPFPATMDHHIIATDARDLLAHWTEGTIEHQQPAEDHKPSNNNVHSSPDDCGIKQKSRRSLTEAERGLTAEPNALRPATTKAGKQRIRMKWSNDVNQFIMRTYYTITSNETVSSSADFAQSPNPLRCALPSSSSKQSPTATTCTASSPCSIRTWPYRSSG